MPAHLMSHMLDTKVSRTYTNRLIAGCQYSQIAVVSSMPRFRLCFHIPSLVNLFTRRSSSKLYIEVAFRIGLFSADSRSILLRVQTTRTVLVVFLMVLARKGWFTVLVVVVVLPHEKHRASMGNKVHTYGKHVCLQPKQ